MAATLQQISKCENSRRLADVVFVHGMDGDATTTWHPPDKPRDYWPKWVGDDHPQVGVWSLGYDAHAMKWSGQSMPLTDLAKEVLELLRLHDFGARPTVFVTHSLGGLLVKSMLKEAWNSAQEPSLRIMRSVQAVVFIATPHAGSNLANWTKYFRAITRRTELIKHLTKHNERLGELATWYRDHVDQLEIKTLAYYETQTTRGVMVVDRASADPQLAGVKPIPQATDHIMICKPKSKANVLYLGLRELLAKQYWVGPLSSDENQPGASAFQVGGTLPVEAPSYVQRACDRELRALLPQASRVLITSEHWGLGKSSLLLQVQGMLDEGWQWCLLDVTAMRLENVGLFTEQFFTRVGKTLGVLRDWSELRTALKTARLAILIDELGALSGNVANSFIPQLHSLSDSAKDHLLVVVTMPETVRGFLARASRDDNSSPLRNPKYGKRWQTIEVGSFGAAETARLLRLLPRPVESIVRPLAATISELAGGAPQRIQALCVRLAELPPDADPTEVALDRTSYD